MSAATSTGNARVLRHRDFRLLMAATVLSNLVMPMQFITLTFWAIDNYAGQKVLISGLIVATRGLGMLAFSFSGGVIADRFERRKVVLVCEALSFTFTALMAVTMLTRPFGDGSIVILLVLIFCAAGVLATDGPSRSASIPVIVGPTEMGRAIGLNNVAQQLTFPAVLPLVGYLTGTLGPGKVISLSLIAWLFILPLVASLRYSTVGTGLARQRAGFVTQVRQGLSYARRDSTIFAAILMIVVLQVVGMPGVGMLGPVWMTQVLGLSRAQFGLIAMLWGLGAVVASIVFAAFGEATRRGSTLATLVVAFGIGAIVFGHSRSVPLTAAANFCLGFAMSGAIVSALTIVQYTVADEMRGRVMGLFPLVMGLSMLNVGPVSAAAQVAGLTLVVPAMGWAALLLAVVIIFSAPSLRHSRGTLVERPGEREAPAVNSVG